MAFYNEFPGNRSYDGDLGWLLEQVLPLIKQQAALASDFQQLKSWITSTLTDNEQLEQLVEEYLNSQEFRDMISSAVDAEYMGDPDSLVNTDIEHYDSAVNAADMQAVVDAYADRPVQMVRIGYSYLNKPIYAYLIGDQVRAQHRGFIVGQMHANEIHTSQIINRMVEFMLYNWDRPYAGLTVGELFTQQTFLLVVPMLNPDGADLVVNGMSDLDAGTRAAIQTAINRDMVQYWNLSDTTWRSSLNPNPDGAVYDGQGNMVSYAYQPGDEKNWKCNLQGIDLHYNCYDAGTAAAYGTQAEIEAGNGQYTVRFAMMNSINSQYSTSGWNAVENAVLLAAVQQYHCGDNVLDIHGRTPYVSYNYGQTDQALKRNYYAALDLGRAAHIRTRYTSSPSYVGTPGYFGQTAAGVVLLAEIGWLHFQDTASYPDGIDVSGNYLSTAPIDYAPQNNGQEPYLYATMKQWAIIFAKYVAGRDWCDNPHVELTELDKRSFRPVLKAAGAAADSYTDNDIRQGYMYRLSQDMAYLHVHVEGVWTTPPSSGTTLQLSELPFKLSRAAGTQQYIPVVANGLSLASTARQLAARVNTSNSRILDIVATNWNHTTIPVYPTPDVDGDSNPYPAAVYIDAVVRVTD